MMTLGELLQNAVAAVCPIAGIAIGDPADKATWRIDYAASATDAQKAAAQAVVANFDVAAASSAEAALTAYDAAVAAGMAISVGGVTATYALDDRAKAAIAGIYSGIKDGDGLPGGGSTFNYPDAKGVMHSFTAEQFTAFAKAVRDWLYALSQGQIPSPPSAIP